MTRLGADLSFGQIVRCGFRQAGIQRLSTGQSYLDLRACHRKIKKKQMLMHLLLFYGAGDEARTRYLHLGKVALYRMSYTRNGHDLL